MIIDLADTDFIIAGLLTYVLESTFFLTTSEFFGFCDFEL